MKKLYSFLSFLLLLLYFPTYAQDKGLPTNGPAFYFNSFQKSKNNNTDSALFFLHKLAPPEGIPSLLQHLAHEVIAPDLHINGEKVYRIPLTG